MAQPSPIAMTALAIGLLAAAPAAAQSWQSQPLPGGGARAFVQSAGAMFSVECTPGTAAPTISIAYQPADLARITLEPTAFSGQGETGDGVDTGYLFFNFDSAAVQQFVHRDPTRATFVADGIGDVFLQRLRSDNRLSVTPQIVPDPVFDSFPLRGSSRAIAAALEACTAPLPTAAPPAPPNIAETPLPPAAVAGTTPDQPAPPPVPDGEIDTGPGTGGAEQSTGPRVVGEAGGFVALAEGARCARSLSIAITAAEPDAFETGQTTLQGLIADVQAAVTADCPSAEMLRISGFVGDAQVYDGVAARATLWTLIALALPSELADRIDARPATPPQVALAPPQVVPPTPPEVVPPTPPVAIPAPPDPPAAPPPAPVPAQQGSSLFGRPPAPDPAAPDPPVGEPGAGVTCPASTDPADYAVPASDGHAGGRTYGRDDDAILVRQETGIFAHYAGAGDDTVFVFGGNAGTHVGLGAGNDTLVFCALNEVSYSVAGGDELSSYDTDTDIIIFEPAAFRGIPAGFQRSVFVYSISPVNDRVIVRLPPDLDAELVDFAQGFPKIVVGDTVIQLSPTTLEPAEPIDPSIVIIEHVPG